VKEFLSQRGHAYQERLVDEDEAAYDDLLALGYRSVPVTVVGSTVVQGFDIDALTTALAAAG
jgi:glutaredoxin